MKVDVLLGLQWGDEGKGKGVINLVGNGVVIDPVIFKGELDKLAPFNIDFKKRLFISKKAHLILPTHKLLDAASETSKGKNKIGSTLKGIGPTYMDKTGRNGLRVGDIFSPNFKEKYQTLIDKHIGILSNYDNFDFDLASLEKEWMIGVDVIKSLDAVDSEHFLNNALLSGKKILAEGAQGTMLDIDFGTYPFVTSSNTVTAGTCTGLGIAPNKIGSVIGIFKAYCTRVGSGPFPTELLDEVGESIRQEGREFGSTTGRPRRCGWIDLVQLKYAIMINGVTELSMMKADVLSIFDHIKICTHYEIDGEKISEFPYDVNDLDITPIYIEMKGWKEDLTSLKRYEDSPEALKNYVLFLEKELNVPISLVSVGPDRQQTLLK